MITEDDVRRAAEKLIGEHGRAAPAVVEDLLNEISDGTSDAAEILRRILVFVRQQLVQH